MLEADGWHTRRQRASPLALRSGMMPEICFCRWSSLSKPDRICLCERVVLPRECFQNIPTAARCTRLAFQLERCARSSLGSGTSGTTASQVNENGETLPTRR